MLNPFHTAEANIAQRRATILAKRAADIRLEPGEEISLAMDEASLSSGIIRHAGGLAIRGNFSGWIFQHPNGTTLHHNQEEAASV